MTQEYNDDDSPSAPVPDDTSSLYLAGFIKISDPDFNEVILEQRDQ